MRWPHNSGHSDSELSLTLFMVVHIAQFVHVKPSDNGFKPPNPFLFNPFPRESPLADAEMHK